jgi:hypothetical protein
VMRTACAPDCRLRIELSGPCPSPELANRRGRAN